MLASGWSEDRERTKNKVLFSGIALLQCACTIWKTLPRPSDTSLGTIAVLCPHGASFVDGSASGFHASIWKANT